MPVTLTTVEVVDGGELTFRNGLKADRVIARNAGLFNIMEKGITVNNLELHGTVMTVDSGVKIAVDDNMQLFNSVIKSLGSLDLAVDGAITVDESSRIQSIGSGLDKPFFMGGGDSRGSDGLGGIHAGCFGTHCAMRATKTILAYGDAFNPTLPGVSGTGPNAGQGGGVINIACGALNLYGTIDVSGAHSGSVIGGGGSGGSLNVRARIVDVGSTGRFVADGGNPGGGTGHPGSGGRVAVVAIDTGNYDELQKDSHFSVRGGQYVDKTWGAPGTYYVQVSSKVYLTTSDASPLREFATVFVLCDGNCPSMMDVRTVGNTEIVFSTDYVGSDCPVAQVSANIATIHTGLGGYVIASACVNMVADKFTYSFGNDMPKLIEDTGSNQPFVQAYFNAQLAHNAWDAVKGDVNTSNSALQTLLITLTNQRQQCQSELEVCLDLCIFDTFERPAGEIQGGDTIVYRVIATKSNGSSVTTSEAKDISSRLSIYLASQLLYSRSSFQLHSYEIRGSSLVVYYEVTVPASGSRAGECLESHLLWRS